MSARPKIETLVGGPVYLDLWVKVTKNWRRSPEALRRFGYQNPEEGRR
jgi:GTP-binding protein Era